MGSLQSKVASSKPLEELTVEEVSSHVTNLGVKYVEYGRAIEENAVDGAVLASIEDEGEIKATMECLEITNFLHQRVLVKEWNKAKEATAAACIKKTVNLTRSSTLATMDASVITMDTALASSQETCAYARPLSPSEEEEEAAGMPRFPGPPPNIQCTITMDHVKAIEPLQLPKSSNLLPPDAPELEPFRQLAQQVLRDLHGSLAETNLVDIDHFENRKGMNNLASAFPDPSLPSMRCHFDQPDNLEICRRFVLGQNDEYYEEFIPAEVAIANGLREAGRYYGQVIKMGHLRVGTICSIVEERNWANTTDAKRQASLKLLASVMEQQLERRLVLLERNQKLKEVIRHLQMSGVDAVLAPPFGPVQQVTASQVMTRLTLFPYPNEGPGQENGYPTSSLYNRRSWSLPFWSFAHQASEQERAHLPPAFYGEHTFGGIEVDPTPIGKRDMEQVALVHSLQLLQMDPLSPEARTIQEYVNMGGVLSGGDFCFISVLDHQHLYMSFPTTPNGPAAMTDKSRAYMARHEVVMNHPVTGMPFLLRSSRQDSICNYSCMTPNHQSFVVHDMAKDQSLRHHKDQGDFGFYCGAPIVMRGLTVGVLCCACVDPRPDFGRAQEQQQEQVAHLIAQQYETWSLKREMAQLERDRMMLLSGDNGSAVGLGDSPWSDQGIQTLCKLTANRPEDYATLIFTEVRGAAALREANPEAMQRAMELHNRILRVTIAENSGYEVNVAETSFHVAFRDVVDAVKFCLQAQEALHAAPWGQDILSLQQACVDASKSFRGLRVSMAIHCGEVEANPRQLSRNVVYGGETFHIAKSLESMGHGGQILVTSDVWNVASHVVESSLGAPQVIDLGSHVMPTKSRDLRDGITTKNVLQLIPKSLALDYLQTRQLANQDSCRASGRVFPTLKTKKSVAASFHQAPFVDNKVSMLSVDTSEVKKMATDSNLLLAALSNRIDTMLAEGCHGGYQCQDFLIAFEEVSEAVRFGLALQERLGKENVLDVSLNGKVRIGVQEGIFDTMGPNPVTGKAEYFGTVVNQVARIAEVAAPGCVYLGKEATCMDEFALMPASNGFMLNFNGLHSLRGLDGTFVLYKCQPCKSWYDQIMDNRRRNLSQPWRS